VFFGFFKESSIPVVIVNVYSSCTLLDKIQMWEDLKKIRHNEPCKSWCILGDFNAIRREGERKGINVQVVIREKSRVLIILLMKWKWWIYPVLEENLLGTDLMAKLRVGWTGF